MRKEKYTRTFYLPYQLDSTLVDVCATFGTHFNEVGTTFLNLEGLLGGIAMNDVIS